MESKNPRASGKRSRRDKDPPGKSPSAGPTAGNKPRALATRGQASPSAIPKDAKLDVDRQVSNPLLPDVFRAATILAQLEKFSAAEIGQMVGVQPGAIEALLVRGRELMHEDLITYLRTSDDVHAVSDGTEDPVGPQGPVGVPTSADSEKP